ncbi:GNAT family N-acetyltransferase [Sphingobacterium zeae]|uniref:RimJ/RimL family protein N-acetyltransferase n=1 Tax=Sphingobacterium zeae TaxID=1776859 RepID=A0ABU0U593_9SPHI|nr:GNAT family protein [Sphingobacterium zeae]MDQ1150009.1 RimJ/RimL family protein N-acetyltransferase [Sphingobacterium zeae]
MITLLQFEKSDFPLFKSWIGSARELLQFAGPYFSFPLTDQQLEKYIRDPKRQIFKITDTATKEIIGHCELNFERHTPRLCRILIAKSSKRNRGYGKSTVNALLKLLFIDGNYDTADLNVYEWNSSAIRCYEGVGFRINENISSEVSIEDETWKSLNMQICKSEWKTNR